MSENAKRNEEEPKEKLWSGMFVLVILSTLCCFLMGQGLNSSVSVYVSLYGGTATYAGVLAAVFSGAAAVTRLASGPLIDERGRRIVMLVGFAVLVAGTFGAVFTHDAVPFVAFRVLQGIGFSAVTTASGTAAADVLPKSRLGEGIGYYGLGQALAMTVGPALALFLVSTDPAENLFWGLSAIGVAGFALCLFCRYEKHPETLPASASYRKRAHEREGAEQAAVSCDASREEMPKESLASRVFERRALAGALPLLVISPAFGFTIFFMGLYGTTIGVGNPGVFFTASAVSMVAIRLGAASLMDRIAPFTLLVGAAASGIAAFIMLLGCNTVLADAGGIRDAVFYVSGIFYGVCIGVAMPVNQSVAVKNTPPERWGAANALFQLANDVGIGVACIVWGIVNDSLGFNATIVCVICCIMAAVAVARATYPRP